MQIRKDTCFYCNKDTYKKDLGKKRKGSLVKEDATRKKLRIKVSGVGEDIRRKGRIEGKKNSPQKMANPVDSFDELPDDLVVSILCKLSSSATSPSDLINVLFICKRLNRLVLHPLVLSKAGPKSLAIRAKNWCEFAQCFLKRCVDAGNLEASYILGMICFYCLDSRLIGMSLMAKAAMGSHAAALYSLAIIKFNGSGGSKNDKDLRTGIRLCIRAALLGHVDAIREVGHCLQDGYGIPQNVAEGRRYLIKANACELKSVLSSNLLWRLTTFRPYQDAAEEVRVCSLLSDFGCNIPAPKPHPANRFLVEWFELRGPELGQGSGQEVLWLCSHVRCGRPETRQNEFRRCSVCGIMTYCSRACQALDWKVRHKAQCMRRWLQELYGQLVVGALPDAGPLE